MFRRYIQPILQRNGSYRHNVELSDYSSYMILICYTVLLFLFNYFRSDIGPKGANFDLDYIEFSLHCIFIVCVLLFSRLHC